MSSLSLSSVLTGANLAMYQTSIPDVLPQQSSIENLQIGNPSCSTSVSGKICGGLYWIKIIYTYTILLIYKTDVPNW